MNQYLETKLGGGFEMEKQEVAKAFDVKEELIGDFQSDHVAWAANIHEIIINPTQEEIKRVWTNAIIKPVSESDAGNIKKRNQKAVPKSSTF